MKFKIALLTILLSVVSAIASSSIEVKDAYTRTTFVFKKSTAIFMEVENKTNKDISIINASSNVSKDAKLHKHDKRKGKMGMVQIDEIKINANTKVSFKPAGYHVMLIDLNKKLKEDDYIDLILELSNGKKINVAVLVKKTVTEMKYKPKPVVNREKN